MSDTDDFEGDGPAPGRAWNTGKPKPPLPWPIQAVISGEQLLKSFPASPQFAALPYKTPNAVFKALSEYASAAYRAYMHDTMYATLSGVYQTFVSTAGARPPAGFEADEWDSALDDEVQAVMEAYQDQLSASWLGEKTVDTRLHIDQEMNKLAASFATEMWREAVYQRETPGKILSAIGIVMDAMPAYVRTFNSQPEVELVPDMNMNAVLNKIMLAATSKDVRGDIALVMDEGTDDFIIGQATGRLSIDTDDVDVLRMAALGGYTPEKMAALVAAGDILDEEASEPVPVNRFAAEPEPEEDLSDLVGGAPAAGTAPAAAPAPAAPPAAPAAPAAAGKGRKKKDAQPEGTTIIPAEALQALRDHSGMKDDDMASLLGFSRATYNNYVKGKGTFYASEDQRGTLRTLLEKKIEVLNGILALV